MRKKPYEILPHTADLKIRAFGQTREEVFLKMLFGMEESLQPEIKNKEKFKREISISSPDLSALLVDFLSEVLYLTQVNREVYNDIKFSKFTDTQLQAELSGQKVKRFGKDIKAVTYHDLDIHQQEDGTWQATVLFDL